MPRGSPEYTGDDLVDDALGVLDALGVERAQLVGMSMGGAIAQVLALDLPDRVAASAWSRPASRIGTALICPR
jgi:pimeloyl-ACP methyl ester carboxylesterase